MRQRYLPGRPRHAVVAVGLLLVAAGIQAPAGAADEAATWKSKTAGLEVRGISSLRIAGKGQEIWYASIYGGKASGQRRGLCESKDKGGGWTSLRQGFEDMLSERDDYEITLDPKDEKILYAVWRGKIFKSLDGGQKWEPAGSGTQTFSVDRSQNREAIGGVVLDPSNPKRLLAGTRTSGLYATQEGGVFESLDSAKTWTQLAGTGEGKSLEASGLGRDGWPLALDSRSDKFALAGGHVGSAWASEDKGRHWKRVDPGGAGLHTAYALTTLYNREGFLADSRGLWRTRDAGEKWGDKPLVPGCCVSVDVDPVNRKQVYCILRGQGLMRTEEDLTKWKGPLHPECDAQDVVCHPHQKNVIYLCSTTTGLWESTDRGDTVKMIEGKDAFPAAVPAVTHVAAHPADANQMIAITDTGWVFASQNRGEAWANPGPKDKPANIGSPVSCLVADPAAAGTWLVGANGVWQTKDGGATWTKTLASTDVEDRVVALLRRADGSWVALWERDGRLVTSKDCVAWDKPVATRPTPAKSTLAADVALDPRDPKHVIVAMRTTQELWTKEDKEGGPFETKDGGVTWNQLDDGLRPAKGIPREDWNRGSHVAFDAATGAPLYAADGAGLFRWEGPEGKQAWAEVTLPGAPAKPTFAAFLATVAADGKNTEIVTQVEGVSLRSFLRSGDGGKTWAANAPDAPTRLVSIDVDPAVPGRWLAGDAFGDRGVIVFDLPGAVAPPSHPTPPPAPPAPPTPPVPPAPSAPGAGPTEVPVEGLVAFTAGADGVVHVWDLHKCALEPAAPAHAGDVLAVVLSADQTRLYTGGADKAVGVWDGKTAAPVGKYTGHEGPVQALVLSRDGARLYAGDASFRVLAWDTVAGKAVARYEGHTGAVMALALSADGARLWSGSTDKTVRAWDAVKAGAALATIPFPAEVEALALSPDGSRLFVAGNDKSVRVYDAAKNTLLSTWDTHHRYVTALVLSPDGTRLFVAGDGKAIEAFSTADGKAGPSLEGSTASNLCLGVTHDGAWVAAGGEDGLLRLWQESKPAAPAWTSSNEHKKAIRALALTNDVKAAAGPAPAAGMNDKPSAPAMGEPPAAGMEPGMGEPPAAGMGPAMGEPPAAGMNPPPAPVPGMGP